MIAALWRKHTFSAAVTELNSNLAMSLVLAHIPTIFQQIGTNPDQIPSSLKNVLDSSFKFSHMLHSSISSSGASDVTNGIGGFHKSFVPEIGSILDPAKIGKSFKLLA